MKSPIISFIVYRYFNGGEEWKIYGTNQTHLIKYGNGDQVWFEDGKPIKIYTHDKLILCLSNKKLFQ